VFVSAALGVVVLSGCGATEVVRRPTAASSPVYQQHAGQRAPAPDLRERSQTHATSGAGDSWEAVFPSPSVAARDDAVPPPELARADARLGTRETQPLLASRQWPEQRRSDFKRPRYLRLPSDPGSILWFDQSWRRERDGSFTPGW
jgi:hypothetical protein